MRIKLATVATCGGLLLAGCTARESAAPAPAASTPGASAAPTAAPAANSESLGNQLYEKSKNPIGDKLPETNPVPNPLDGVYKNPFAE